MIDPIIEEVLATDYSEEEDPLIYKSEKTGRGPMPTNWLDQYQTDNPPSSVMCAYKLIKVEFRYWGMQVRVYLLSFKCFSDASLLVFLWYSIELPIMAL